MNSSPASGFLSTSKVSDSLEAVDFLVAIPLFLVADPRVPRVPHRPRVAVPRVVPPLPMPLLALEGVKPEVRALAGARMVSTGPGSGSSLSAVMSIAVS